jgi:hypothetical protein
MGLKREMDIQQMKLLFNLTNEQAKLAEDYFLKAEIAEIKHCPDHDIEWMDFEPGCYACIQEREKFEAEKRVKDNE